MEGPRYQVQDGEHKLTTVQHSRRPIDENSVKQFGGSLSAALVGPKEQNPTRTGGERSNIWTIDKCGTGADYGECYLLHTNEDWRLLTCLIHHFDKCAKLTGVRHQEQKCHVRLAEQQKRGFEDDEDIATGAKFI